MNYSHSESYSNLGEVIGRPCSTRDDIHFLTAKNYIFPTVKAALGLLHFKNPTMYNSQGISNEPSGQ